MEYNEGQPVRVSLDISKKLAVSGVSIISSMTALRGQKTTITKKENRYGTIFYNLGISDCIWHENWLEPICGETEEIE